ncbi:hypothetical protein N7455_007636 [Penicillium solitum]|uniref:uncharacterized protein n=1 Tax=Penicillium solitum TaxID=60172 RepID=UPI0032C40566|nr:hypothetical protein N7455_007636 [Penicillium solitum]
MPCMTPSTSSWMVPEASKTVRGIKRDANMEKIPDGSVTLASAAVTPDSLHELLYSTCTLGRLSSYYVDVRDASHISATLRFAHAHNIRISVKNTGHDFFGRSSVPNTLAIWTHNLDSIAFSSNFTANNCLLANSQNVGELGAGVIAADAYHFFSSKGMDITGGYEQSVGLADGFAQGGGVGSFTTTYGLMADNAVEFEVVTADGEIRTINQCNEPTRAVLGHAWWRRRHFCCTHQVPSSIVPFSADPHIHIHSQLHQLYERRNSGRCSARDPDSSDG